MAHFNHITQVIVTTVLTITIVIVIDIITPLKEHCGSFQKKNREISILAFLRLRWKTSRSVICFFPILFEVT